jgi:alpha-ketoglutarate-dependent 2,4-dichlorophenoxyacetate dioxygenase
VPPEAGETEFADTRAAFDALPKAEQERLERLTAIHCLANSRRLAGTAGYFDAVEAERFPPTEQPLIRLHEGSGRKALYIGSHAQEIVGMSKEDGEALLNELLAFATQPQFVYRHTWRVGDLVMWDNRATLHRALPFDETKYKRDLRRTATTAQGQRGPPSSTDPGRVDRIRGEEAGRALSAPAAARVAVSFLTASAVGVVCENFQLRTQPP